MRTGGLEVGLGLDGAEAGLGDIHYARVGEEELVSVIVISSSVSMSESGSLHELNCH